MVVLVDETDVLVSTGQVETDVLSADLLSTTTVGVCVTLTVVIEEVIQVVGGVDFGLVLTDILLVVAFCLEVSVIKIGLEPSLRALWGSV